MLRTPWWRRLLSRWVDDGRADLVARVAPKGGNVPRAEIARRRARNKRARASRKANR